MALNVLTPEDHLTTNMIRNTATLSKNIDIAATDMTKCVPIYPPLKPRFLLHISIVSDLKFLKIIAWDILHNSPLFKWCTNWSVYSCSWYFSQISNYSWSWPNWKQYMLSCGFLGVSIYLISILMVLKSDWYCPFLEIPSSQVSRHSWLEAHNSIFSNFLILFPYPCMMLKYIHNISLQWKPQSYKVRN